MRMFLLLGAIFLLFCQRASSLPRAWKRDAPFKGVRTHLDRSFSNRANEDPNKYFHESVFHSHYDGRFGSKELLYGERCVHLRALAQAYLAAMNDIGIETFLVHGTLLGWWWNRQNLPWDDDVDVMVSEESIFHLANYYNMTIHRYKLSGIGEGRDYLLEVNPHYWNNSVDMINKIDARWIDTDTGLFIDITTLRRNTTAESLGIQGAMMVKDKHHYKYDDIFPLRRSTFEGFPVKIPYAYADLLLEEYGQMALTNTLFLNHRFDTGKNQWAALGCKDFGSCRYFRNSADGIHLPVDVPTDADLLAAAQAARQGKSMPQTKKSKPVLNLLNLLNKPLPPQLLNGRPWRRPL